LDGGFISTMTQRPNPIPLRPDYAAAARNRPIYVERAAYAAAFATALQRDRGAIFAKLYPNDDVSPVLLTRAAVAPGSTTTSGWASQLVQSAVWDFFKNLVPISAAAALAARGASIPLDDSALSTISIPYRSTAPRDPHFVTELSPMPVRSEALAGVTLGPVRKIGSILVVSRTLLKRSGSQNVYTTMLREDASYGLDAAVFSSETGSGDAHEGLLHNVTTTAGTGDLLRDLQTLAAAVSVGGSGQVVFIGGPGFAAAAGVDGRIKATILPSLAVPETRLIAVDPLSLIWGAGTDPEIDVSTEAVLHMDDDPAAIVASGTAAVPTRSMFQTDCVATRMILPISFAKRRAGAVAYIDGISTTW
jgi:hypothetical protein